MKTRPLVLPKRSLPRTGATTVEMALVGPILFVLVFGLFEFALGYSVHHLIQDAARQGCRAAICNGQTNSGVLARVNTLLKAERVDGATTRIMVNSSVADVSSAKPGDRITVQITVPASKVAMFPTGGHIKGQLTALCTLRHD